MAKLDRAWVAAVLAANAEFDIRACQPAFVDGQPHHGSDTFTIQHGKRIGVENVIRFGRDMTPTTLADHLFPIHLGTEAYRATILALHIEGHKLRGIIAGKSKGSLRQVIRAE